LLKLYQTLILFVYCWGICGELWFMVLYQVL
jgi:hypothetical protein